MLDFILHKSNTGYCIGKFDTSLSYNRNNNLLHKSLIIKKLEDFNIIVFNNVVHRQYQYNSINLIRHRKL